MILEFSAVLSYIVIYGKQNYLFLTVISYTVLGFGYLRIYCIGILSKANFKTLLYFILSKQNLFIDKFFCLTEYSEVSLSENKILSPFSKITPGMWDELIVYFYYLHQLADLLSSHPADL